MSHHARKSPFGRTQLFHDSHDTVFKELQCAASVTQRSDGGSKFHTQGCGPGRACWHCCHDFEGSAVRLPRVFDAEAKVYHVYGNFCTLGCAKTHLKSLPQFNREQHMYVFRRMCREVYGVDDVIGAPPRVALQMFGGPFGIQEFRTKQYECQVHMPPFVSYCMVVEEKLAPRPIHNSSIRGMRIPNRIKANGSSVVSDAPMANRYRDFCEKQQSAAVAAEVAPAAACTETTTDIAKKRRVTCGPSRQGGLSGFIKKA